jgi:hypothetical protein
VLVAAAVVVFVVVLQTRNSGGLSVGLQTPLPTTSAPSPTPVQAQAPVAQSTPVAQPSPPQAAPPPVAPSFTTFAVPRSEHGCSKKTGGGGQAQSVSVQVAWATANATSVWIAEGSSDAANAQFMQLPTSGNQTNFSSPISYDCSQPSSTYTMTLVGTDGDHVSKTWTVINGGNRF